jgi:hypothetical protein
MHFLQQINEKYLEELIAYCPSTTIWVSDATNENKLWYVLVIKPIKEHYETDFYITRIANVVIQFILVGWSG